MEIQTNTGSVFSLKEESVSIQQESISIQQVVTCPGFTPIPLPDAAYQSSTTKIDISGIPEFTEVNSITDGTQTVTFSTPMERRQVPGSWATWSSPPFSEDSTPPVLYSQRATTLTMTLSVPSRIFGFELEPEPFAPFEFTAVFLSGGTPVGEITREVNGDAGARLFAADVTCCCLFIDQVVITGPVDFAIAQVRYTADDIVRTVEITCPDDITVFNDPGMNGAIVNYPDPIVNSTCPATVVCTPPSGSFFPPGNTTVTCTATDTCGNSDTCTFNVKVIVDPCRFFSGRCRRRR